MVSEKDVDFACPPSYITTLLNYCMLSHTTVPRQDGVRKCSVCFQSIQSNTTKNVKYSWYNICKAESCDQNETKISKIELFSSLQEISSTCMD